MLPSNPKDTGAVSVANASERDESGEERIESGEERRSFDGLSVEDVPTVSWKEQAWKDLKLSYHRET
jgi:hypothetical protein